MKTKKYLIAFAIIGGFLFTAFATSTISSNGQESAKIEKKSREIIASPRIEKKSREIIASTRIEKKSREIIASTRIEKKSREIIA